MFKIVLTSLIASFLVFASNVKSEELDAGLLLQEIKHKGAKSVIVEYWMTEDYQKSERLVNSISTGEKKWLEVAKLLLTESDAAITEDLFFALSLALPKNPIGVLSLLKTREVRAQPDVFFIDWICRDPYYEDTVDLATEEKFLKDAEKALVYMFDQTQDKDLDAFRWQCLERIRRDLRIVEKDKDKFTVPEKPITEIPSASSLPKQEGSPPER